MSTRTVLPLAFILSAALPVTAAGGPAAQSPEDPGSGGHHSDRDDWGWSEWMSAFADFFMGPETKVHTKAEFTDLSILLNGAFHAIKKRSLIFIVSDFISCPGWERPIRLLNQRHEVLAVQLWHPFEKNLPDIGSVFLQDSETGEQLYIDTHDRKLRRRFTEIAQRRESELESTFLNAGVDFLSLSTEDDLVRSIVDFASRRRLRRR